MPDQTDDVELVNEVLSGNVAAFGDLVKRHQRYVFTLAMGFVKNREDAEEIAQDSFVKVYRSLATWKRQSKFTTWMYSIVYYTAMTFLRKRKQDWVSIDDGESPVQIENHESDYKADQAEKRSRSEVVQEAIRLLLPDDAMVLTLFYQGEQSLEEIARATGFEAGTVKVKLHRARMRLKENLSLLLRDEVRDLMS